MNTQTKWDRSRCLILVLALGLPGVYNLVGQDHTGDVEMAAGQVDTALTASTNSTASAEVSEEQLSIPSTTGEPSFTVNDDVKELFSAYVNALGGKARLNSDAVRVYRGILEVGTMKADFESIQSSAGHFVSTIQLPGNTKRVGYDSRTAWSKSGTARWSPISSSEALREMYFRHLPGLLNWETFYTEAELFADTEINGRSVKVVKATTSAGASHTIYFDGQNKRVVRLDESGEGISTTKTTYSDYRAAGPLVLPFLERTEINQTMLTRRIDAVETQTAKADGFFGPPTASNLASTGGSESELRFDRLVIGGIEYVDVRLHHQTNSNVLIRHSRGIQTIRLTDLPEEDLAELRPLLGDMGDTGKKNNVVTEKWEELSGNVELREQAEAEMQEALQILTVILIPLMIASVIMFLIWSYMLKRICDKTDTKGGLAVWIPIVQMLPMNRAAGISDRWTGAGLLLVLAPMIGLFLVPQSALELASPTPEMAPSTPVALGLLGIFVGNLILGVISLIWPFRIFSRCNKSPFLGLLMFLPVVNVVALAYLAFSRDE